MFHPAFILLLFCFLAVPALKAEETSSQALLYDFQGDVFLLKEGNSEWFPAQKGVPVAPGDVIWCGKESFAEISLDKDYRSIFRVEKDTKAEIRTLNPTDIYLEDGSVYSMLDGLPSGQTYQIVTPTAVASVRGTHFYSDYAAANQLSQFALMPQDDKESELTVKSKVGGDEGEEVALKEGQEAIFFQAAKIPQIQEVAVQKIAGEKTLLEEIVQRIESAKAQNQENPPIDLIFIKPGEKQKSP